MIGITRESLLKVICEHWQIGILDARDALEALAKQESQLSRRERIASQFMATMLPQLEYSLGPLQESQEIRLSNKAIKYADALIKQLEKRAEADNE